MKHAGHVGPQSLRRPRSRDELSSKGTRPEPRLPQRPTRRGRIALRAGGPERLARASVGAPAVRFATRPQPIPVGREHRDPVQIGKRDGVCSTDRLMSFGVAAKGRNPSVHGVPPKWLFTGASQSIRGRCCGCRSDASLYAPAGTRLNFSGSDRRSRFQTLPDPPCRKFESTVTVVPG